MSTDTPAFPTIETAYHFYTHLPPHVPPFSYGPPFPTPDVTTSANVVTTPTTLSTSTVEVSSAYLTPIASSSTLSSADVSTATSITSPTSSPALSHHAKTGLAVGIALALGLSIIILGIGFLFTMRRIRRKRNIEPGPTSRSGSIYNGLTPPPVRPGSAVSNMTGSTGMTRTSLRSAETGWTGSGLSDWEVELKTAVIGRPVELRPLPEERSERNGLQKLMLPIAALPAASVPGSAFGTGKKG